MGLVETWSAISGTLDLARSEDWDKPTSCPGWSVRDVVSHISGFELMISGTPAPQYDTSGDAHVKNFVGQLNEAYVAERRSWPPSDVRAEFERLTHDAAARLAGMSDEEWEVVGWSPEGQVPFHRFMETRILDSWIHLQDIRDALAMPSDDHGIGEEIVVNRFEAAMPYVIGRRAEAPEGSRVRFSLIGRLARNFDIEVVEGRARAATTPGEPIVEIVTPVALFWRRAAGRISADAFLRASSTEVIGDRDLAVSIGNGMAVMI